tara:strand:+ start:4584 stop:5228 length:645 start_codon:yes stop_codon:yes gene_type:complete
MLANHYIISGLLSVILFILFKVNKDTRKLYKLLKTLLVFNLVIFFSYLTFTGTFNYKTHLPLHLCYLTEIAILFSLFFKKQFFYPIVLLNSFGGGVTGFLNSNLAHDDMLIEHIHLYVSHFNLLLFSLILFKERFTISKADVINSMTLNGIILIITIFINQGLNSNYWFTKSKPPGANLTNVLPEWPFYLIVLIAIGMTSYFLTFKLYKRNSKF